jgi:Mn-dependent DtxR family transcriptional regulator
MNSTPDDHPLLIAVSDLFRDHRSRTRRSVAEQLNVSEAAAMTALERLERLNVLVRSRGGTDTPVWKLRPRSTEDHVSFGGSVTPS